MANQFSLKSFAKNFQTTDPEHAHAVYVDTKLNITAVERVEVADLWGGPSERVADVDTVVLALRRRSRDGLAAELAGAAPELLTIGDALAPRPTAAAFEEAERVALTI